MIAVEAVVRGRRCPGVARMAIPARDVEGVGAWKWASVVVVMVTTHYTRVGEVSAYYRASLNQYNATPDY